MPSATPPSSRAAPPSTRSAALQASLPPECRGPRWDPNCGRSALCPSRGRTSCVQGAGESVQEWLRDEAAQPGTP